MQGSSLAVQDRLAALAGQYGPHVCVCLPVPAWSAGHNQPVAVCQSACQRRHSAAPAAELLWLVLACGEQVWVLPLHCQAVSCFDLSCVGIRLHSQQRVQVGSSTASLHCTPSCWQGLAGPSGMHSRAGCWGAVPCPHASVDRGQRQRFLAS